MGMDPSLLSKEVLHGGESAAAGLGQAQEGAVPAVDPVSAVGQGGVGDGIAVAHPGLPAGGGDAVGGEIGKIGIQRQQDVRAPLLHIVHGDGPVDGETGGHGAPQGTHGTAAAQRLTDIVAKRADATYILFWVYIKLRTFNMRKM